MALIVVFDQHLAMERPLQNGLLDNLKEWQLSGLYGGHMHWAVPKCLQHCTNPLELEFIETGIYAAFFNGSYDRGRIYDTDTFITNAKSLLDNYPAARLLLAIPLVLRALSSIDLDNVGIKKPSELLKYILYRLQCITSEEEKGLGAIRNAIRGLHSWYIVHCLMCLLSRDRRYPHPAMVPDMELLYQLSNTLHLNDEWHRGVLFEFQSFDDLDFELIQGPHFSFMEGHYALLVGNFATSYQLLDRVMFDRFSQGLNIEVPQTSTYRFEPILIADMYKHTADFYTPDTMFHRQIEHLLCAGLPFGTDAAMENGLWPSILKCSASELNMMDSSMVFNYVMDEVRKRSLDFIYITGIMWLGDIFE
jgi:hypothetical protein